MSEHEVSTTSGTTKASYTPWGTPIRKFSTTCEIPTVSAFGTRVTGPGSPLDPAATQNTSYVLPSGGSPTSNLVVGGILLLGAGALLFPEKIAPTMLIGVGAITVAGLVGAIYHSSTHPGAYWSAEDKKPTLRAIGLIAVPPLMFASSVAIFTAVRKIISETAADGGSFVTIGCGIAFGFAAAAATTCLYRRYRSNKKKVGTEFKKKASPCKQPELIVKSQEEPKRAPSENRTVYTYSKRHDGAQTVEYH